MVIVYQSNTGFTQRYAQMLGKAEKLKVYEISQARQQLQQGSEVLYMGPLMAGHISGIDQAVKRYTVKAVCGVGMTQPGQKVLADLGRANYVPNAPIFYLQGGWAPKKVGWLKRRMVNMATKSMRQALQEKGTNRTSQEQAQLDMLLKGGDFVAYENLDSVQVWIKQRSDG